MTTTYLIRRGNIREQLTIHSMQKSVPYVFGQRKGTMHTVSLAKVTAMIHVRRAIDDPNAHVVRLVGQRAQIISGESCDTVPTLP